MSRAGAGAVLCCLVALVGCTTFPVIEAGVCGNAVIEEKEACDTFDDGPYKCRQPGILGECQFDCSTSPDGGRNKCPPGTGCADDGICHAPSGEFDPGVKFSSDVSSWVSSADFDGDERRDIISSDPTNQVQQARFRLHYFDADGNLEESRPFPRVTTRPLARQLNGDHAADLIFSNDQISMLPGRPDRDWVPASFSSYVLPGAGLRAVGIRDGGVGQAIGLAVFAHLDEGLGVYVPSLENGKLSPRAALSRPIEDLAGSPVAADVAIGNDSPCLEVIYAYVGDEAFHVLDLCEVGSDPHGPEIDWRDQARHEIVQLPHGLRITSPPVVADVNGDGDIDVLIGGTDGADLNGTFVTYGDGTKLENEAHQLELPILGEDEPFPVPMPLAAGDLTGDGIADFVLPLGVVASHESLVTGELGYFVSYNNNDEPWSTAVITDLNANDLPDLIAGANGAPGLSFLNGTGGPLQIAARVTTQGPLRALTTGDYDGDLIEDVAYLQGGPPGDPKDSLAIAFGKRDGAVPAGVRVAELAGVQQLGSVAQGPIDSLFATSTEKRGGVPNSTFTLFDGSPDRLPLAPYALVTFSVDGSLSDSLARLLLVGGFVAPDANDVVAVGGNPRDGNWTLWLVPDIGGGKQPPKQLAIDDVPAGALPLTLEDQGGRMSLAGAAADLDGDGFHEVMLVMPQLDDADPPGRHCVLLSYDIDSAGSRAISRGVLPFDESCPAPELSAADLNGDGADDLLLSIGDPKLAPRTLRLLYNDGHGQFSAENSAVLQVPGHDVRGYSLFQSPPKRLAFVTEEGLYLARGRKLDAVLRLQDFTDARSVVVTDPNGDKIEDIVVADAAGLWLLEANLK